VSLVAFVLVGFTPLANALNRWLSVPAQLQPAEAIVVLGGGMWGDEVLSPTSLRRALHGITLFQRGFAPLLAFSGPAPQPSRPAEAEVRAEMARSFGVPPTAIVAEPTALTTRGEASGMATLLRPRGVATILLVTSSPHMARSRRLFERAGFSVYPAPVEEVWDVKSPEARWGVMRSLAQEIFARLYYRVAGYL
jgi:uncharacterized SAM-binding protein YcdF (DUF218 family)